MGKKYYETDEFKKLQSEWYQKLEAEGFEDIEKGDTDGIIQPQIFSLNQSEFPAGLEHYQYCQEILRTYPLNKSDAKNAGTKSPFRHDVDRKIFELHSEGTPEEEISKIIKKEFGDDVPQRTVGRTIQRIKEFYERES